MTFGNIALLLFAIQSDARRLIPCPGLVSSDANEVQDLIDIGPRAVGPTSCACNVAENYTVDPGFFRLNISSPALPCREGSYCPGNMTEPTFCCPGYVCSRDTTSMSPCEEGTYCPPQSVQKLNCPPLAVCEARTDTQDKWGTILFIFLFVIALWSLWYLYNIGSHQKEDIYLEMIREVEAEERARSAKRLEYERTRQMLLQKGSVGIQINSSTGKKRLLGDEKNGDKGSSITAGSISKSNFQIPDVSEANEDIKMNTISKKGTAEAKTKLDDDNDGSFSKQQQQEIKQQQPNFGLATPNSTTTSTTMENVVIPGKGKILPTKSEATFKNKVEQHLENINQAAEEAIKKELHFTIRFEDLEYRLPDGFTIMQGVSGEFKEGRLCAIMGPSGAGKTTLFNLITGKAKRTGGRVLLNEEEDELSNYKRLVGFVPQEDVMLRSATVTDVLNFSARRRLPSTMKEDEVNHLVAKYIYTLGIGHVADSIIGDERRRGISGGQRKRVNVGLELVSNPSVLFLDEPTTGLDASTALDLCRTLKFLCHTEQLTAAAVIHSPSQSTFEQFDDFCLLGRGGQLIYMGERERCLPYFQLLGFQKPPNQNPADFFLEVSMGRRESKKLVNFHWSGLFGLWKAHEKAKEADPELKEYYIKAMEEAIKKTNQDTLKRQMSTRAKLEEEKRKQQGEGALSNLCKSFGDISQRFFYVVSVEYYRYWISPDSGLLPEMYDWVKATSCYFNPSYDHPTREQPNFFYLLYLCFGRAFKQTYGVFDDFMGDLVLPVAVGLLVSASANGLAFVGRIEPEVCEVLSPAQQIGSCTQPVSDGYQAVGNFLLIASGFAGITMGSSTFGAERTIFYRQASTGLPVLPYFFAKVLADLPKAGLAGILTTVLFFVQFFTVGSAGNVFGLLIAIYFCFFAQGYFLSILLPYGAIPLIGVVWTLFWAIAFGGTVTSLSDRDSLDPFLQWLFQMSPFRWGNEAFYINEINFYADYLDVQDRLDFYGYNLDNFTIDIGAIMLIGLFYWGLTILALKMTGRDKMK